MPETTSPIVAAALDFQKLSAEAFGKQRNRENDDLEFQVPEKQWPDDVRAARAGGSVGGVPIPARPMLSIPKLDQPIQLTFNQWLRAHYGIGIHPLSADANDDTAKVIQGLYRAIEVDSRANIARGWGFDRALKAGFGAYRVNVVYDDSTDDPMDQKIVLQRILRQSSVYWDPFAQEPDFSDMKRGMIVSYVDKATYDRDYPESDMSGLDDAQLTSLASDRPFWVTTDEKAGHAIAVAEYFYTKYEEIEWVVLEDGRVVKAADMGLASNGVKATKRTRVEQVPVVMWAKINAVEVLEEQRWNGKYIPIIPCIGKELQPFDGERRWQGMIGPNKDSARLFNYEVSNAVETDALRTKAPWLGAVGQFRTNNAQWQMANVRNLQYLEYDPVTVLGNLAPPPHRNLESPDLSSSIALIQIANENIQAGTALFDESLGKNTKQKSGIAVQAIQQQGDLGQSHWLANMADISMTYEAKVILDLLPKIYDRPERIAQIIGEDDSRRSVMLNAPFVADKTTGRPMRPQAPQMPSGQPQQPGAVLGLGQPPKPPKVLQYDLAKGKYGVVVSVGKAYQTRAQEGSDALTTIIQADPNLMIPLGPIWAKFQDWPGHQEVADVLKRMQPPQLQDEKDEDDPEVAKQQLAQATQLLEMAKQEMGQLQQAAATEQAKYEMQTQVQIAKDAAADKKAVRDLYWAIKLQKMKDATAIRVAEINALVKGVAIDHEHEADALAHDHEAEQADMDRQHQGRMAAQTTEQDALMAQQAHEQELEAGAQGVAGQATLAEQGHRQALAQGQQAAALAPQPENGAGA